MAITLADAQVNTQDDVDYSVIDNLRRYSWLLDHMVFDDTVTPGTGGGTLTYAYTRLTGARGGAFRAINNEYTPAQAKRQRFSVDLVPMGGSFQIDRVLSNLGPAASNEVTFQMQQLLTGTRTAFQTAIINGDTAVDANGFDGLDKGLTGTDTEYLPINNGSTTGYLNWSTGSGGISTTDAALAALDTLDDWLSRIVPSHTGGGDAGAPGALPPGVKAILGNTKSITRIKSLARRASLYTQTQDSLGRTVQQYGDWVLIDLGDTFDGSNPIIPIETRDPDGAGSGGNITGLTDIYAVTFGLDSFHGAAVAGQPLVRTWMPPFDLPGAVKNGEIEIGPVAPVLKNTRAAAVLRNVKVV
ncbi:major capsid protein [Streptomyces sp. NPDC004532]